MRCYLLVAYCTVCVANASLILRSHSVTGRDFTSALLPRWPGDTDLSFLTSLRPRPASQKYHNIYQKNSLFKRGIPAGARSSSNERSSTPDDNKQSSKNGKKQNGSSKLKQRKFVDPIPRQSLVAEPEPRGTAPPSFKTPHRNSVSLIAGNSRDGKKPHGPDPGPPDQEPSSGRSKTPPARVGIAVTGQAVAYTKVPTRPIRFFTGGIATTNKKVVTHPQQVSAGGTMFRSVEPGHHRFDDMMAVHTMGKHVKIRITPHVGGLGLYQTDNGLEGSTWNHPPGMPLEISGASFQPGQTTYMRAQLNGPGTIEAKADNQNPRQSSES